MFSENSVSKCRKFAFKIEKRYTVVEIEKYRGKLLKKILGPFSLFFCFLNCFLLSRDLDRIINLQYFDQVFLFQFYKY